MKRPINFLWAAAHTITPDQFSELDNFETRHYESTGVTLLEDVNPDLLNRMKNNTVDTNLGDLAEELLNFCVKNKYTLVQPAGSPKFQFVLGIRNTIGADYSNNNSKGVNVLYSFSERVSEDIPQEDGSIKKVSVFKHLCFQ